MQDRLNDIAIVSLQTCILCILIDLDMSLLIDVIAHHECQNKTPGT